MGAQIIWQNSKYRCENYEGTDTEEVIIPHGPSTKTYPLICYSHTPVIAPELHNRTSKGSAKPLTVLNSQTYRNKFTTCNGHRAVRNPAESEPDVTAVVREVSQAEQINTVRNAIQTEITRRKQHAMYNDKIADAENPVSAHDIELKDYIVSLQSEITNADKEGRGFPTKQINFTQYVSASDLNTLKDITIEVMRDCICYSDCNMYAVCWCHGYCNYY